MSEYRDLYLKKMNRMGSTRYERGLATKQREFVRYFENALNKETCYIDSVETKAIFQDHSQSNNKDLSDDKYVIIPNETKASIGSYINWRNSDWLVFTEEEKTIPTHQQMKVKEVNWNIRWVEDGKVVNDGKGWGAYVQNQTLYTLGVSFSGDLASIINGKMMMYVQNNKDTARIKIGYRIFVGSSVYKILFADTISRNGLINLLMEEDTIYENDNKELGIADYWNRINVTDDEKDIEDTPIINASIVGEGQAKISKTYLYTISEGSSVEEWIIEGIAGNDKPFYILERDANQISLQFKDDFRYVGQTVNIIAKLSTGDIISLPIRVVKKF